MLLLGEILAAMIYVVVGIMIQHTFPNFYSRMIGIVVGVRSIIILPFRAIRMGWDQAGESLIRENNGYRAKH